MRASSGCIYSQCTYHFIDVTASQSSSPQVVSVNKLISKTRSYANVELKLLPFSLLLHPLRSRIGASRTCSTPNPGPPIDRRSLPAKMELLQDYITYKIKTTIKEALSRKAKQKLPRPDDVAELRKLIEAQDPQPPCSCDICNPARYKAYANCPILLQRHPRLKISRRLS